MDLLRQGYILRIYIGESDKHEGKPLFEWIVRKAREQELAGATVLRGLMGFGPSSRIYTSKILRLSEDMPLVIEIVDTEDRLEAFLETIDSAIQEGMATLDQTRVRFYRGRK